MVSIVTRHENEAKYKRNKILGIVYHRFKIIFRKNTATIKEH